MKRLKLVNWGDCEMYTPQEARELFQDEIGFMDKVEKVNTGIIGYIVDGKYGLVEVYDFEIE